MPRTYHCAVEVTADVLGGKWTPVILAHLKEAPVLRYGQLRRLVPDITEKMLTQRLRELERLGLVRRTLVSATPPHVEYDLTTQGRTLAPVLDAMFRWGETYAADHDLTIDDGAAARPSS